MPAQRHLILGRVAQERRQHAKALVEFAEAAKVWPNNAFARYYTALSAEHVGDFDRALEEYRYASVVGRARTRARARRLLTRRDSSRSLPGALLEVAKAPL